MSTTDSKKLYEDGSAELILLRSARPFVTLMALMLWAYTFAGMPMPADVTEAFVGPLRQIILVLCIASVGAMGAVWIGGMFAPKGGSISKRWMLIQLAFAMALLGLAVTLLTN